ncbi:c-type cytochrome [Sphingobacterium paludis]|uniref:Mono/diheme cytochrome c family protein n=1 Tax=Sphingobacterium paludis TaxID=1476465 RepID=A0A4R7DA43_9SPHI|nr:c-type cytochrome [Sphingobacterium paludis]TDS17252.1 mono/diheme cytochrome c family protein [Sphingobacterium paludis]
MQKKIRSLAVIGLGIAVIAFSCQPNVSIQTAQYAVNGQKLYQTHCQNCHGAKGEGLGALYPPLTDTVYQRENRHRLACIVKFGLNEPVSIHGETYDGPMPGVPQLSPIEIAYILTYITTRFGNSNDNFTQEEVKKGLASCK